MFCRCCHSGYCLYRSNSTDHSSVVMGGRDPSGFQSVMERPDLVRRVTPPMCTMPKTREEVVRSHLPSGAWGLSVDWERIGRPLVTDVMEVDGDAIFYYYLLVVVCNCDGSLVVESVPTERMNYRTQVVQSLCVSKKKLLAHDGTTAL